MFKFLEKKPFTCTQIIFFICFSVSLILIELLSPVLGGNDAYLYASIAKHIVEHNDWINLINLNQDWLDKPHFQFWMVAVSFKIFGINAFAYMLPAFLFNFLGAFYTFLLGKHLFQNEKVGLFAALFYLSAVHILLNLINISQETYLLGEIIPACYYWYLYYETHTLNKKHLFLGAVFTACAMMTKGIFVLLPIFSGLMTVWIFKKQWHHFISKKLFLAILLSFLFIFPEIFSLYLQFDSHPEKIVFNRQNVSGIQWFFWESQFGRFMNSGAITRVGNLKIGRYFYYIHTFMWAYLPWICTLVFAIGNMCKSLYKSAVSSKQNRDKTNYIYILGSFIPTFILFSLSSFQIDHYTNILIPFAAILCADWIINKAVHIKKHPVFIIQIIMAFVVTIGVFFLSLFIFKNYFLFVMISSCVIAFIIYIILMRSHLLFKAIFFPLIAVFLVYLMLCSESLYKETHGPGYQISKYLKDKPQLKIISYKIVSMKVNFFLTQNNYTIIKKKNDLLTQKKPYYLIIEDKTWKKLSLGLLEKINPVLLNKYPDTQSFFKKIIYQIQNPNTQKKEVLLFEIKKKNSD